MANPKFSSIISRFIYLRKDIFHEELALKADFHCQVSWENHFFQLLLLLSLTHLKRFKGKHSYEGGHVGVKMKLCVSKYSLCSELRISLLKCPCDDASSGFHPGDGETR